MYVLEWRTVSALTRGLFLCLFPELRSNEENKYKHNTRVSTETVRHESTYIILFLTRHNESIYDDKKTICTHHPLAWRQTPETGSGVVAFTDLAAQFEMQIYIYWYTFCHL